MVTQRDDDYLICKHYYDHIEQVSPDFKDFITFEHNDNHYFAWVHDGKVVLRSEAYPDHERMVRGIKAIIKNWDLPQRYSVDSAHGAHFLVLWGGGDHQAHTGNFESHNEIGRSCPVKSKDELYGLLAWKGADFASKITGVAAPTSGGVSKGAAAATAAASLAGTAARSATSTSTASRTTAAAPAKETGGGFKWWYLLPLLLLPLLFFLWKGCGDDKAKTAAALDKAKTTVTTPAAEVPAQATATETATAELPDANAAVAASESNQIASAPATSTSSSGGDNGNASTRSTSTASAGSSRQAAEPTIDTRGNKNSGY